MAMGRRKSEKQPELFLATQNLAKPEGHAFYDRLNKLLAEAGFDNFAEAACVAYYDEVTPGGRPSIVPGVYFRMLFVGYFEGIDSQRGIAWRCHDSLSLRSFLGVALHEDTPDHTTLSKTRNRLPQEVHEKVFQFVLQLAETKKLLSAKTVAVDSTMLEANAAMKAIVRKDTGEDYKEFLKRLAAEAGIDDPSDEELRRFDQKRKGKTCSNQEWESATDPDSRIAQMKDGRTHLAYKAEHVVDLDTELVLAAEILPADAGDAETLVDSVVTAQGHLNAAATLTAEPSAPDVSEAELAKQACAGRQIEEVAADKGYHKASTLTVLTEMSYRTYIPEQRRQHRLRWADKPGEQQRAVYANRRRVRGARGKRLQRLRSERVERSFAHMCETGGGRRTWLRGIAKVAKRYLMQAAAHNLGVVMRKLFGVGKPKCLQEPRSGFAAQLLTALMGLWAICWELVTGWCQQMATPLRTASTTRSTLQVA
jgi:transposase